MAEGTSNKARSNSPAILCVKIVRSSFRRLGCSHSSGQRKEWCVHILHRPIGLLFENPDSVDDLCVKSER